jgi:hypothetical protein
VSASRKAAAQGAAERLATALGTNLVAVVLFGHAGEERPAHGVGENLLIVVGDASVAALRPIATAVGDWTKASGSAPLIFGEAEWRASADVFPLEIEDMRGAHALLAGRDPFAGVATTREDLRRQLEREVRGKLLQLRAEYAAAAPKGKALEALLTGSAGTFLVLFRATLRLAGRTPPGDPAALVADTAAVAGLDASALDWVLGRMAGRRVPALAPFDPVAGHYLAQAERLAGYLDGLEIEKAAR